MTEKEWIKMGYANHLIEAEAVNVPLFEKVYRTWFNYKRKQIKPQSLV